MNGTEPAIAERVTLREIDADNLRDVLRLEVLERQRSFVAGNAVSLAQALFAPEAWYRVICVDGVPAGFVMLHDESLRTPPPAKPQCGVWRLMVDARFQGRGVGRAALRQVIEHVRAKGVFEALELSFVPGPGSPEAFYKSLGFRDTGRVDEGEVVLSLPLGAAPAPSRIGSRLHELGLALPAPLQVPPGVVLPFAFVRVVGTRALIAGHGPTNADGSLAPPLGKVGGAVTINEAYAAARLTALAVLGSLQRTLGDLDRIAAWTRVFGMVNAASGFNRLPAVVNGFSDLILEVFGPDVGAHARSAVGMAELPFDIPVEVEGEVALRW